MKKEIDFLAQLKVQRQTLQNSQDDIHALMMAAPAMLTLPGLIMATLKCVESHNNCAIIEIDDAITELEHDIIEFDDKTD